MSEPYVRESPPRPPPDPAERTVWQIVAPFAAIGLVTMVLSLAALFLVSRHLAAKSAAAMSTPPDAAGTAVAVRATVTLPPGLSRGVVRATPSLGAAVVGYVQAGAVVEMTKAVTTADAQTWCRVKTTTAPELQGWMHSDILRTE